MDKRYNALPAHEQLRIRRELLAHIENHPGMPVTETIRMLRKGLRMTIPEYARLSGVSGRALHDIENGQGNPSLKTLEKLLGPFGLHVGVVRPAIAGSEPPPTA